MDTKRWVAVFLFFALLILQGVSAFVLNAASPMAAEADNSIYKMGGLDRIAIVKVDGVIAENADAGAFAAPGYNHKETLKHLEDAFKDSGIKAIILHVNSPGGGVYESDELYQKIVALKKQYNKPIITYMGQMAASGGYYIAAATDKIIANRNTITGSIGVVMEGFNFKELMEKYGVKNQTIASGANKTIMSPFSDMTEEQRKIMQSIIDETYGFFVDVVSEGRKLDRSKVLEIADGRIYTALQAQKLGLVDEVGSLDVAIVRATELSKVKDPTVIIMKSDPWSQLMGLFEGAKWISPFSAESLPVERVLPKNNSPAPMYLCEWSK